MSDAPQPLPEPAPAPPAGTPLHRLALRLLLAGALAGPVCMLGTGAAMLLAGARFAVNVVEAGLGSLALGVVCAAVEVGAEVTRRLGRARAGLLVLPGAVATFMALVATVTWVEGLSQGLDPLGAAERIVDHLGRMFRFDQGLAESGVGRALLLLALPLLGLALLRAARARPLVLFPLAAAASLPTIGASWLMGWSTRGEDLAVGSWPLWVALGLRLVDHAEPRVAARLHRAVRGDE